MELTDKQFEALINESLDELPQAHVKKMLQDVAVTWASQPTEQQRTQLHLHNGVTLFGLYEGRPLTERYQGYDRLVPDKITIFKEPILAYCHTSFELKNQIKKTVWHEMAHYFGLNHEQIHGLEQ